MHPMKMLTLAAAGVLLALGSARLAPAGEAIPYTLVPRSTVLQFCTACPEPAGRPEALVGSFSLTPVNLAEGARVEALTDVRWESASYKITGSGFIQYDRFGKLQVELQGTINGEEMRLRATRRQPPRDGLLSIVLATPRQAALGYLIVVTARIGTVITEDTDNDGVSDAEDNCRGRTNREQADGDGDGVGDVCDRCAASEPRAMVSTDGCSLEQRCPCDSPREGGEWTRGAYARCVARALRDFRHLGLLSRREAGITLRRALRSGCGQTILASL
jgi:hypothetical protein